VVGSEVDGGIGAGIRDFRSGIYWGVLLLASFLILGGCGGGGGAGDDDYPEGDVEIMAPADPGGGWDQTARAMQSALT